MSNFLKRLEQNKYQIEADKKKQILKPSEIRKILQAAGTKENVRLTGADAQVIVRDDNTALCVMDIGGYGIITCFVIIRKLENKSHASGRFWKEVTWKDPKELLAVYNAEKKFMLSIKDKKPKGYLNSEQRLAQKLGR